MNGLRWNFQEMLAQGTDNNDLDHHLNPRFLKVFLSLHSYAKFEVLSLGGGKDSLSALVDINNFRLNGVHVYEFYFLLLKL